MNIERTPEHKAQFQARLTRISQVLILRAATEYEPDCPACLRGLPHTQAEHEQVLERAWEASRA